MAIAQAVISRLLQSIGDQVEREVSLSRKERDLVEWVEEEFRWMEFFLKDMSAKAHANASVRTWVRQVREIAHEAEDMIDVFILKIAPLSRRREQGGGGCLGAIFSFVFILSEWKARHELLSGIQRLKYALINERRAAYGIQSIISEDESSSERRWEFPRTTYSFIDEEDVVGLEEDALKLMKRLTQGEPRRCVVGIVGMGGLGKTVLARILYGSRVVQMHFDTCAWISVSQVYVVRDLLQSLILSCRALHRDDRGMMERMDNSELRTMLSQHLAEKRYLVVLDDMWKPEAWDALQNAFPDKKSGSRILLTTRNKDVALHADARSKPHELGLLRESDSWELFTKKLGRYGMRELPPELGAIGRELVRECHGLPLAIIYIAGPLLRKERSGREWMLVKENINRLLVEEEIGISGIPSLSYEDLPNDLKPCFLYLATFPDNYWFPAKKLVKLWAAEGFLHQRGDETLEEVGQDCLKELTQRSLVQVATKGSTGAIKSCRIDGLSRDLCISKAKEEGFLEISPSTSVDAHAAAPSARRIAIHRQNQNSRYSSFTHFTDHQNLRSIMIYGQDGQWLDRRKEKLFLMSFKLLRVLDINQTPVNNLPSEIGELVHLRYLGLTGRLLTSLPLSIGNLINLQTLFIESGNQVRIPNTIARMRKLRHLQVKGRYWGVMDTPPRALHMSSNLYTLANVWAGNGKWLYLKEMKNLRKLGICLYSKERQCVGEGEWESIVKLESLESLYVSSVTDNEESLLRLVSLNHLTRLSKLRLLGKFAKPLDCSFFPPHLAKLSLKLSHLKRDPLPKLEKLQELRVLELLSCSYVGEKMVCSAGGFPTLQSLIVEGLNSLEEWRVEEGSMPFLLYLKISKCEKLKSIPEELKHVDTLVTDDACDRGNS